MSNLSAPLPVMAGEDMPAGPADPIFNRLLKDRIIWMARSAPITLSLSKMPQSNLSEGFGFTHRQK